MPLEDYLITSDSPMADVSLVVYGDRGCFTPAQFKPENHTLPIITPTSARGILDHIVLDTIEINGQKKPAFRHIVTRITALQHPVASMRQRQNRISQFTTNGVEEKTNVSSAGFSQSKEPIQRSISILHAPAFLIESKIALLPIFQQQTDRSKSLQAYVSMFNRRVSKGQTFKPICLGLSMFPARIKSFENEPALGKPTLDIGPLLYDYVYNEDYGTLAHRRYFHAIVKNGIMDCNWLDGSVELVTENEYRVS